MPGFARFGRPSKILTVIVCTVLLSIVTWVVGYTYLVRIARYPSAGFFALKMIIGLFAVSFTIFVIFSLRGFFKRPPQ